MNEGWIAAHAEQPVEFAPDQIMQRGIVETGEFGLARSADEAREGDVSGWRAPGEQRARKKRAEDLSAFDLGYQQAESVQWMRDILAPETHEHRCYRRVFDFGQAAEEPGGQVGSVLLTTDDAAVDAGDAGGGGGGAARGV